MGTRQGLVLSGILLFALLAATGALAGRPIIVTNTNDSGPGSLRQCIEDALPGDEILFDPSLDGQPVVLTSGKLVIDRDLTITGRGPNQTIISTREGLAGGVLTIHGDVTVSLSGATVTNGRGGVSREGEFVAGGITIADDSTVTLDNCVVTDNHVSDWSFCVAFGGGILNSGTLTITHSTISSNGAELSFRECPFMWGEVSGGGIANLGTLTISYSDIVRNQVEGPGCVGYEETAFCPSVNGGGIANLGGELEINHSTIRHNSSAVWRRCYVSGEYTYVRGGGIVSSGTLTLNHSEVFNNHSYCEEDGVVLGGGIYANELTVTDSTIHGNDAQIDCEDWIFFGQCGGGGIMATNRLTLSNSTVSGNNVYMPDECYASETTALDGIDFLGGGVWANRASVTSSTITGNWADGDCSGIYARGEFEISNSIVANQGSDCCGAVSSLGYNLDSDGTCGFDHPTDLPDTDPMLGPLQDNYGPTWTHVPLPGSPVIDRGSCGSPTDQRGVPRPLDGDRDTVWLCDIGAVEYISTCDHPDVQCVYQGGGRIGDLP